MLILVHFVIEQSSLFACLPGGWRSYSQYFTANVLQRCSLPLDTHGGKKAFSCALNWKSGYAAYWCLCLLSSCCCLDWWVLKWKWIPPLLLSLFSIQQAVGFCDLITLAKSPSKSTCVPTVFRVQAVSTVKTKLSSEGLQLNLVAWLVPHTQSYLNILSLIWTCYWR